ncbi:hypothetical protein DH2020_018451 [Rehmannia glutinosa]|uniref:Pectinesterase n=1 Tax=Rehmannia glutinosa TaxID=99300 RepID=A0ABR0WME3_REHGL
MSRDPLEDEIHYLFIDPSNTHNDDREYVNQVESSPGLDQLEGRACNVNTDGNAKIMRYKSWSYYKDWCDIFGKDRATGHSAEGFVDDIDYQYSTWNIASIKCVEIERREIKSHLPTTDTDSEQASDEYDPSDVVTVAADGTGNFTTVSDAINFAPNNSVDRVIIYVREGVYEENVEIPSWKTNIVLLGDGSDVTVISGNRSVADAVSGEGFLARDITFENTAGPERHQAVALRINADLAAVYRCTITGYQDTLYVHSFRQFYRECDIYGTIDFIFGNAAVVFQGCNIVSRMPMPGQFTVITAQSRDTPDEDTGISMQNCTILATDDLYSNSSTVKSFLGRPWRNYSRTVYLESYVDDFIAPEGWSNWDGDQGLETLYYGEYENYGPGSSTDSRVSWPGYHVMDYYDAYNFTVSEFITGQEWLDSTSFPYDDGV